MAITIFTDGSSRGNPGPGGWGAIVRTEKEVRELGGREDDTTNNRMEISAAINALAFVGESGAKGGIVVQTDSRYLINGITGWISGWKKNGWKTKAKKDVENRDLWEALHFVSSGFAIEWKYVEGHAGHPGNERCDEIATGLALGRTVNFYHGSKEKYPIDLDAEPTVKALKKKASGGKAYSYVSLVDGTVEKHSTWAECEARVHGAKGAKYKKTASKEDEESVLREWGF